MPSESTNAYETLRDGLMWGRWKSGERLIPQHLKLELDCKSSALREALVRLAGEGFIISEKNLGFQTIPSSPEALQEAAHMRMLLEREAVALSLKNGDFEWEIALSAAYQKLAYVEKQMSSARNTQDYLRFWSRQDWEFHVAVIEACGSGLLKKAYQSSYDLFRMYAVATIPNFGFMSEANVREHKNIYEAAITRDVSKCIEAIETHISIAKHHLTEQSSMIERSVHKLTVA